MSGGHVGGPTGPSEAVVGRGVMSALAVECGTATELFARLAEVPPRGN